MHCFFRCYSQEIVLSIVAWPRKGGASLCYKYGLNFPIKQMLHVNFAKRKFLCLNLLKICR